MALLPSRRLPELALEEAPEGAARCIAEGGGYLVEWHIGVLLDELAGLLQAVLMNELDEGHAQFDGEGMRELCLIEFKIVGDITGLDEAGLTQSRSYCIDER